MKTTTQAPVPQTELEVIYVTAAGKRNLLVQPDGDTLRIGENTHTIPAESVTWNAEKKGRKGPVCIIREGITQAIPIHNLNREGPSPREFDNAAHTDLLRQLNSLARDNQKPATPWPMLIAMGIAVLVLGGGLFAVHGGITDLQHSVHDLQAAQVAAQKSDVTVAKPPAQPSGLIGVPQEQTEPQPPPAG